MSVEHRTRCVQPFRSNEFPFQMFLFSQASSCFLLTLLTTHHQEMVKLVAGEGRTKQIGKKYGELDELVVVCLC